jgi:DNA-binding response OmpR family regulator/DNA-binding CsgD family transcriptional regulator
MKKILIIEDEQELSEGIAEILKFEGYTPFQSGNGLNGLKLANIVSPDLILCDIVMPDIDGYEVLKRFRKESSKKLVPFIFITALTDRKNYRKGMELGADDYLTKPFTRNELLNAVTSKMEKYSDLGDYVDKKIFEIESGLENRISELKEEINEKSLCINQINAQKKHLGNRLQEKELELMKEALNVINTNNTIHNLKNLILAKLRNENLTDDQKMLLLELKTKVSKKNILCNGWLVFQMKFNQAHPDFVPRITAKYAGLTQYELVFFSATYTGLTTSQMADLLNISQDSVRKSRYRIKKKIGLKREDDFLKFVYSFGSDQ